MKGKQKRIRTRWPALLLCMGMVLTNVSPAAAGAVYAGNAKTVGDIPQSSMQASAESAKEAAANAIDGDSSTKWHTSWDTGYVPVPHSIILELDDVYDNLTQLRYLPRQDKKGENYQWNGDILAYEISVSETDSEEDSFTKVAIGSWAEDKEEKSATFAPVSAKYVKLTSTHTKGNSAGEYDQYTSAAEIHLAVGGETDLAADRAALDTVVKQAEQYISEHDTDIAKLQALAAKGNALLAQPLAVEEELQQQAAAIQKELNRLESGEPEVVYDSISPNIQWMDHKNEMIQAHGGCVIWDEATQKYYWYGEHKGENHTSTGGIVAIGVSCYSSTDLYN